MANPLRVVVLQDGGVFVAQCLEIDICAQGRSEEDALKRLTAAIRAEAEAAESEGRTLADIGPAPAIFHTIFKDGPITRTHLQMAA